MRAGEDTEQGGNATFHHASAGTPEEIWRPWLEALPVAPLPFAGVRRVLVIAPHPDDETLGAGGLLANACELGVVATVLLLTDGECAAGPASAELGAERRREFERALWRLAAGGRIEALSLQLPDGMVGRAASRLEAVLAQLLEGFDLCVGPFEGDGHPDHSAAGAVARRVAFLRGVPYLAYPIWFWHWSAPCADSPLVTAQRIGLSRAACERKAGALGEYVSQQRGASPVLSESTLAYFRRDFEVLVR